MVIPFENKLYEKLNEEEKTKNNESFAKKIITQKNKPEAITKYLSEIPPGFLENNLPLIKPESSDDTVINASFNESDDMEYEENLKEEEPVTKLNENIKEESFDGEQNLPKKVTILKAKSKQANLKRLKNKKKLNSSQVREFLGLLPTKIERKEAYNTRSRTIKSSQTGNNILNWYIYRNIY